jgi:hypothetical protein
MKKTSILYIITGMLAVGLSSCSSTSHVPYSPQKKYSPQELQEDLQLMEQTLRRNHPSLHWYASEEEVQQAFAKAYRAAQDSLNENTFRNLLNETVSVLRCGHTSVRNSRQYNWFTAGSRPAGFPLGLKITDDSTLIVTSNLYRTDSILRRGVQLTSINNRTAKQLIDTLLPLVPIDGYSNNFSYQNISNNFGRFYNSRFPLDSSYEIQFYNQQGILQTTQLRWYDPKKDTLRRRPAVQPSATAPSRRQLKLQSVRSFTIDSSGRYALLRINTFTHDFKRSWLRKRFRDLRKKKVDQLVVDVRNNGGGLIQSSLLLTRLVKQTPFTFTDSITAITRKIESKARISKRFYANMGMTFLSRKINDTLYRFRYFQKKEYQPHRLGYNGNIYILTGGFSFSATTMFLANVKGQENITLVGEETGGGWYGNNGVFIPDIILPHTRLRVRLPLYRIINKKHLPANGSGVLPDVEVKPTAENIRSNSDPKMEKALELIRGKKETNKLK